jgi:4-amino-4-deoxy-L-arabinose transferase-like glycosyltransferase
MTHRLGWSIVGLALLLVVALFPVAFLAARMIGATPADAVFGLHILRAGLAINGLLALAWAMLPSNWFRFEGLPPAVSGLQIGPEGWVGGPRPIAWPWLLLILGVGAALRLIGINQDLWLDEIATVVGYLRLPPWQVLYTYSSANQHLLYSMLGSLSFELFGESAWASRLPALLYGVGGLAALYYLARAITSEREALWASAFMAVAYHHVWFSQSARGYTGMIFWSALGSGLFLRGLAQNRTRTWAAYVVAMTLGIMTLQNTAFVFMSHPLIYVLGGLARWPSWRAQHWPLTRRVLASVLLVGLLSLEGHSLVLPQMLGFFGTADRTNLGWRNILEFAPVVIQGLRSGFGLLGLAALLILLGAGCASYWQQSHLIVGLLTLPALLNGVALVALNYGAYPRSFLYLLPLALLLAVRGAMALGAWVARRVVPAGPWRATAAGLLGPALVGLMLAVSSATLVYNYRYPKQDYTGALAYVLAHKAGQDSVCAVGLAGVSYASYYQPTMLVPATVGDLATLRRPGSTVWVLYSFNRDMRLRYPQLYDYIQSNFDLVTMFPGTLGDGTLYVARSRT